MKFRHLRSSLVHIVSLALVCTGFGQTSYAGVIETVYFVNQQARAASLDRVEVLLASDKVSRQLEALGVDKTMVAQRVQALSDAELLALEQEIDKQVAAGDALSVIGATFLVLLILELLGVTDVFKSI